MKTEFIDQWFPVEQQRSYISMLTGRVGLTRRRAECFVRLWTYLLFKQQQEMGELLSQPLSQLPIPAGFVPCTHREAAELFYADKERGSDRAAGMMIDKLTALGLIEKQFDGNNICLQIRHLPNLNSTSEPPESLPLDVDAFNPRTDAVPVANFLARNYNWMNNNTVTVPHKIAKLLRGWANQYPTGMRVLRRCDNAHPVGFYLLYPTAAESEENFFRPPSQSLHLSSASDTDPLTLAKPGAPDCTAVFVRSWMIDTPYKNRENAYRFLEDVQKTLKKMQADFPNLCDFYGMTVHPSYEALAMALGFQKIGVDPKLSIYWVYTAIDRFIALDLAEALSKLDLAPSAPEV